MQTFCQSCAVINTLYSADKLIVIILTKEEIYQISDYQTSRHCTVTRTEK
jgi:hypothetical protein